MENLNRISATYEPGFGWRPQIDRQDVHYADMGESYPVIRRTRRRAIRFAVRHLRRIERQARHDQQQSAIDETSGW